MPTVANGTNLEADLRRARAENLELDWKPRLFRAWRRTSSPWPI